MNRTEVIQRFLDQKKRPHYLEIGVFNGDNFFRIRAKHKIGVDPKFRFSWRGRLKWNLLNPCNLFAKFLRMTSDEYFATEASLEDRFDLIFIDGLHTYQQSRRDAENALRKLTEGGVIVMHDCNPPHQAAAYPAENKECAEASAIPGWTGDWCGDVWKTIVYFRSTRRDLNIFTLDCDYGLGIISKGIPENPLFFSETDIDSLQYQDFANRYEFFLNLKPPSFLVNYQK